MHYEGTAVGVVRFTEPLEALSCAIMNGGDSVASALMIMQVPHDYMCEDPLSDISRVRDGLGLPPDTLGMMTAAEVDYVFNMQPGECHGTEALSIATAGLSNHVVAGEELLNWGARHEISLKRWQRMVAGTINIAVVSPVPLTMEGKINLMIPLVEGKTAAMQDRGFRETGTTSDAMAVLCPAGDDRCSYTGTGSRIGIAAARAVRAAVGHALEVRGERPVPDAPGTVSPSRMDGYINKDILQDEYSAAAVDLVGFVSARFDSMVADGLDPGRFLESLKAALDACSPGDGASLMEMLARGMERGSGE